MQSVDWTLNQSEPEQELCVECGQIHKELRLLLTQVQSQFITSDKNKIRFSFLTVSADSALEASWFSLTGWSAGNGWDDDWGSDGSSRVWRNHFWHCNTHTQNWSFKISPLSILFCLPQIEPSLTFHVEWSSACGGATVILGLAVVDGSILGEYFDQQQRVLVAVVEELAFEARRQSLGVLVPEDLRLRNATHLHWEASGFTSLHWLGLHVANDLRRLRNWKEEEEKILIILILILIESLWKIEFHVIISISQSALIIFLLDSLLTRRCMVLLFLPAMKVYSPASLL